MSSALRRARKRSGLTQRDIAGILDVTLPTAAKYDKDPSSLTLGQLGVITPELTTEGREIMSDYATSFFGGKA